jgi:hypothetical protein
VTSDAEYLADLKARLGYPPPGAPVRLDHEDLEECLRRWPLRAVAADPRLVLLAELLAAAPPS